ncbi:unnamed protein product [Darwinula stevensoni]|uniref:Uncharacterized protein n=1 Tax=Darwinula stevensoni TaxID=69355 RepID=A0A7R9AFP2_9CRUS|nr:unnamed protein product [Darwinula stevensoni]CAG0903059.1 unnamed protein product [Darwinula stevensoni]
MAATTIGRLRSIIDEHHPAASITLDAFRTAGELTRHTARGTHRMDGPRAMKVGEKKGARGEPPRYLKWMCITSSITGDFPLTDLLHGHPKFRWLAFPTSMFFIRLLLIMLSSYYWLATAGDIPAQIYQSLGDGTSNKSHPHGSEMLQMGMTLLQQRSKTAFTVLIIVNGSFVGLGICTPIFTFFKARSLQVVFEESRKILVDAGLELKSKELLWSYFLPGLASFLIAVAINVFFIMAGFPAGFVTVGMLGGMHLINSIFFPPFLCIYFCSVVAETYRWLTAAISDPRVTKKDVDVNLWDKRLKEFVGLLSSALGIQVLLALVATIITTTATLFMVLIELNFNENTLNILATLSSFALGTLASWSSTAVFLRAAHRVREEEAYGLKRILQSEGVTLTGSGFVRLGYPVYYDIARQVIMYTIIFLQFRSSEHVPRGVNATSTAEVVNSGFTTPNTGFSL